MPTLRQAGETAKDSEARVEMWRDMFRMEGWRELVGYLESRYHEISDDTPDSVKGLAARNARLTLIRDVFRHIRHDFNERDRLTKELAELNDFDDQIPDPFAPV